MLTINIFWFKTENIWAASLISPTLGRALNRNLQQMNTEFVWQTISSLDRFFFQTMIEPFPQTKCVIISQIVVSSKFEPQNFYLLISWKWKYQKIRKMTIRQDLLKHKNIIWMIYFIFVFVFVYVKLAAYLWRKLWAEKATPVFELNI